MAILIRCEDADFIHFIDKEFPYANDAIGYWVFGESEELSIKNLSKRSDIDAAFVGVPTVKSGHIELTESAYIDTKLQINTESGEYTMISIASPSDVADSFCGTWYSEVDDMMLYSVGTNDSLKMAVRGSGANIPSINPGTGSAIRFMAGVKFGNSSGKIYLHNGTTMLTQTGSGGGSAVASNNYIIGPFGGVGNTQSIQKHVVNMLFDRALNDAEINEIYSYFKLKLTDKGIDIL